MCGRETGTDATENGRNTGDERERERRGNRITRRKRSQAVTGETWNLGEQY